MPQAEAPAPAPVLPNVLRFPRSSAVMGEGAHAGEVAHFGGPLREQRLLAQGRAVADLQAVRVLTLTGPDALSWLNSLTTQKIDTLRPGQSTETLVLSPTGHIEHWLRIHDDGERLWLLTDGDAAAALGFLESMKFMMRVELADVSADYQCLGFDAARLEAAPASAAVPGGLPAAIVWADPWPEIGEGSASYAALDLGMPVASPEHPGGEHAFRIAVCDRAALADWDPAAAGLEVVGRDAWEALRIEAWRPGLPEVDHKSLVGELDVLRTAVHLAKGCYRGQEAVARIHNLGQPPRRLVFLHLDGSAHALPAPDAEVRAEVRGAVRAVGRITSAALHHELGPIALALVKRSLPVDEQLLVEVDGGEVITAAPEPIVAAQRENRSGVPKINRDVDQRHR
ncbi:folate-binding protein YgfZ [Brevibacterium sp. CS2]|uniref:CAF17-like 4Fe-4S cluster assembly/insertion protein YgfZ n=1 Tax=Brevibacterium sp. CS2 TaxID=2575923 RepID=UPI0020C77D53|nr:glycine cleavage T C-terminal barrel domain-containing protein [Brevibacterium sp. CS2]